MNESEISNRKVYLFSVDVEDIRLLIPNGERFNDAVPEMTIRYLDFLRKHNSFATFFIVGDIARRHPDLIRRIVNEGHEIGCHTDKHVPLNFQTPESFKKDLENNVESLLNAGAKEIRGFRAPIFSLTAKTSWAYKILAEKGLTYSSSVLPGKNPLYGWKEFGEQIKSIDGITEIPMSLSHTPVMRVPFGGGLYFRVLPQFILQPLFSLAKKDPAPIGGYFHPYDIDSNQEHFMQPGINNNKFYNFLMYYNRNSVFPKLEALLELGFKVMRYDRYLCVAHGE